MSEHKKEILLVTSMYFSYGQFFIYDTSLQSPACDWTIEHSRQGFARRDGTIAAATLLEFGHADLSILKGFPEKIDPYERVLSVPLKIDSGVLAVDGPEEFEGGRTISVHAAWYMVTIAQKRIDDENESIDLFIEKREDDPKSSKIVKADKLLSPLQQLLETAMPPDV